MKKFIYLLLFVLTTASIFAQRSYLTYYELTPIMQTSPGAFKYGLYGFENPAITSYLNATDLQFSYWNKDINGTRPWGLFMGNPYNGFGLLKSTDGLHSVIDYRYSLAFGSTKFALGLNYGFVGGDKSYFKRSNTLGWGALVRPNEFISIGAMQHYSLDVNDFESAADIAIRPFGDKYPLSIFADASMFNNQSIDKALWSAGISWELVQGVRINGRYFSTKGFSVGADLSFGNIGVAYNQIYDQNGHSGNGAYSLRLGALDRTIFPDLNPEKRFLKLDINGEIKYRKNIFFDNSVTLFEIINKIEKAKTDKNIAGIVMNLTNITANKELLWEIRKELESFKETGKKVVVFIDRAGIDDYHFASVADKIVMDELGTISLEGYILGRSFYKKMLDNAHIGFDEIRLFKYKSAVENFARDQMSAADKEQRQELVNDWFDLAQNDITRSRNIKKEDFQKITNETFIYSAEKAKELKLIDTTGRWTDCDAIMGKLFDNYKSIDQKMYFTQPQPFDDKWSYEPKQIAVIYALGECSMDAGINARELVKDLQSAMNNKNVAAIVLRIDSPGGDALASDYIAEVLRQNKGKKPVIVSQGAVAASGGYWLSMYADTIVASPMTITGSIGVISSWIYDKGLKDTIGISTDYVKAGKFADLGFAYQFPILGLGLPTRNLSTEERGIIEKFISDAYEMFTKKVADGRKIPVETVKEIAQGRVWSGVDGKDQKLVDVLGGLQDAIDIALDKAGIKKDDYYNIIELPKQKLFDFNLNVLGMLGLNTEMFKTKEDILKESLKFRLDNNGKALMILPIDYYDSVIFK